MASNAKNLLFMSNNIKTPKLDSRVIVENIRLTFGLNDEYNRNCCANVISSLTYHCMRQQYISSDAIDFSA